MAAIFAEGCLITGEDYANAAQIFQHGTVPAHFYQVYLWAERGRALGSEEAASFIPKSIDRFLLYSGYKQLFASNASGQGGYDDNGEPDGSDPFWCLDPVAEGVTDAMREAAGAPPLEERIAWVQSLNEGDESLPVFCDAPERKEPPKWLFPGIW
ncbi:hypothetical protein [Parvularcula maris]|uniref:Uncharacterized protein n=1 Tax=Parvularcula maris TaxID=2965077 RepID=A0A9X2L8R6_9PROT|nr:hypothetical protein [Parvularcula maris]MCQ8185209.1 hypothetical protein [Parvularcula maris]